ncbi:hypothetical protein K439DRAFT_107090 [Ramaria rubella]|nr:hypothetical protein K439DRAFT_107090 [Ramaria rubella]
MITHLGLIPQMSCLPFLFSDVLSLHCIPPPVICIETRTRTCFTRIAPKSRCNAFFGTSTHLCSAPIKDAASCHLFLISPCPLPPKRPCNPSALQLLI